jgi:UPF0271 protein
MMRHMRIDLNCDCGESFGAWALGDDAALLQYVTSANIACGAHAGDPDVMRRTVRLAHERGVAVGAHPGYPDLIGFGRRTLPMTLDQVANSLLAQLGALWALARAEGVPLTHVKPHGALYNDAAINSALAGVIAQAVHTFDPHLILVGLAGCELIRAGQSTGLRVAQEAFADRRYEADGTLRSRTLPGAVIDDPDQAAEQALNIVQHGYALTLGGQQVSINGDTLCLHGDLPGSVERASVVRRALEVAGVVVHALER